MRYCTVLLRVLFIAVIFCSPTELAVAGNMDRDVQEISLLIKQAHHAENFGKLNEAEQLYKTILEKSKSLNYQKGISGWYQGMVFIACQKRQINTALQYAHDFENWAEQKGETAELPYVYYQYGMIYRMNMKFDSSFYFLEKTARIIGQNKDLLLEAKVAGAMSYNYARMEMADNSISYGKKAFELYRTLKDSFGLAKTLILMAPAYNLLNDTLNWYKYCNEGLRMAKQIKNPVLAIMGFQNLGIFYLYNEKEDLGFKYLDTALNIAEQQQLFTTRNEIAVNMAKEHNNSGNYEKTISIIKKIYADTVTIPLLPQTLHLAMITHYDALKGLKRYPEANQVLEQYLEMDEQIYLDESRQLAQEANDKLKQSEQAQKLALKQWQIKKQNLWLVALGLGLLASVLLILYLRKKEQSNRHQIATLQKDKELESVKARMNGQMNERIRMSKEIHDDLGSSLTTIGLLTDLLQRQPEYSNNPDIQKISTSTREMVTRMNDIVWSVNSGNDSTTSLLAHIRKFGTEFLYQAGIQFEYNDGGEQEDKPLNNTARRNIYLTVKEALHNIVKHSGATRVQMQAVVNQETLRIIIADNGKGFTPQNSNGNGQGLANMKTRMEEIGGEWHINTGNETRISICYPLNATGNGNLLS